MLENTSKEFREDFILILTKEIIENTSYYRNFKNRGTGGKIFIENRNQIPLNIVDLKKNETKAKEIQKVEIKKAIIGRIKEEAKNLSEMQKEGLVSELDKISKPIQRPFRNPAGSAFLKKFKKPFLNINEPPLPETVSYLKPVATPEEIDIGRLNILINDPLVKSIECVGPSENIYVVGVMGRKKTPIKLSKDEVDETTRRFSERSKIPLNEGLFKAAVGNLVISSVISNVVGTQFIIRKISREF